MSKQFFLFSEKEMGEPLRIKKGNKQPTYPVKEMVTCINKNGEISQHPICCKPQEDFVAQANEVWGGRYDYTDSVLAGMKEPITIYCPKHDYHFTVTMAQNHVKKIKPTGCPICRAEEVHHREFGTDWRKYLKLCAKNSRVGLIANVGRPKLSDEERARRKAERDEATAERQRIRKEERRKAYEEKMRLQKEETRRRREEREAQRKAERKRKAEEKERQRIADLQERFLREAPLKQGEGYQYRDVDKIVNSDSHVLVHCPNPDHEWHPMLVRLILQGCKCRECAGRHVPREKRADDFLKRAYKKYGTELFDLSRVHVQYINNDTYVEVRCLKHNLWYLVTPDTFIRKAGGCPICNTSKGEMEIILWLREHDVRYEKEPIWTHNNMFCKRNYLKPDFWLPDHNLIIEYNGEQHYENVGLFRRDKNWTLEDQQERDMTIRDLCREKNIRLLEIPYTEFDHIKDILAKNVKLPKK